MTEKLKPPKPCTCKEPNEKCDRAGEPMTGRLWQLCSGNCPKNNPCTEHLSALYRAKWDRDAEAVKRGDKKPPPTPKLIVNATAELAVWIAHGRPRPSKKELAARVATCESCPDDLYRDGRCLECGCGIEAVPPILSALGMPGKAEMLTSDCPKKHWAKLALPVV